MSNSTRTCTYASCFKGRTARSLKCLSPELNKRNDKDFKCHNPIFMKKCNGLILSKDIQLQTLFDKHLSCQTTRKTTIVCQPKEKYLLPKTKILSPETLKNVKECDKENSSSYRVKHFKKINELRNILKPYIECQGLTTISQMNLYKTRKIFDTLNSVFSVNRNSVVPTEITSVLKHSQFEIYPKKSKYIYDNLLKMTNPNYEGNLIYKKKSKINLRIDDVGINKFPVLRVFKSNSTPRFRLSGVDED